MGRRNWKDVEFERGDERAQKMAVKWVMLGELGVGWVSVQGVIKEVVFCNCVR